MGSVLNLRREPRFHADNGEGGAAGQVRSLGQESKEFARVDEPERPALPTVKIAQNGTTK